MNPQPIREWQGVDREAFREKVATLYEPAVLRGVVSDWPAVRAARQSGSHAASYLASPGPGRRNRRASPRARGEGAHLLHRQPRRLQLRPRALDPHRIDRSHRQVRGHGQSPFGGGPEHAHLRLHSGFRRREPARARAPLGRRRAYGSAAPWSRRRISTNRATWRAWWRAGGASPSFRPSRSANLYIGPLDFAPTGTPISLVSFREPDFERFPRFREALANARVAELEPGRRDLHPAALVAPRGVARAIQRAGELLVEGAARGAGPDALRPSTASTTASSTSSTRLPSSARRGARSSATTSSTRARTRRPTFPRPIAACWDPSAKNAPPKSASSWSRSSNPDGRLTRSRLRAVHRG